jgi:hypothetical protein
MMRFVPSTRVPHVGTGLYSQLERYGLPEPEAVFSIGESVRGKGTAARADSVYPRSRLASHTLRLTASLTLFNTGFFRKNPKPFHMLAKELFPGEGESEGERKECE